MLFQEQFEDTKGAIRTGKSKTDRQYKDKAKKDKSAKCKQCFIKQPKYKFIHFIDVLKNQRRQVSHPAITILAYLSVFNIRGISFVYVIISV